MDDQNNQLLQEIAAKLATMETPAAPTAAPEPFNLSSLIPKTPAQAFLAFALVAVIGGASVTDIFDAYKGFIGQPNVVVDSTPYESLNIRMQAEEADTKKKNERWNDLDSELVILRTQMETILNWGPI